MDHGGSNANPTVVVETLILRALLLLFQTDDSNALLLTNEPQIEIMRLC